MKIKLVKQAKEMTLKDVKYGQAFKPSCASNIYVKLLPAGNTGLTPQGMTWVMHLQTNEFVLYSFSNEGLVDAVYDVELELTEVWSKKSR